ncbi:MAG: carboxymuconolactone decarboxylase family protein [Clostridia bacterium]
MQYNPKELLKEFQNGMKEVSKTNGEEIKTFMNLTGVVHQSKAIDEKNKELISIGISAYIKCEYCITYHIKKAFDLGASKEEVMEAALVSTAFGGGAAMASVVTLVKDCIEAFAK